MKKTYIILIAAIIIFIAIDIVFWLIYQKNVIQPNINSNVNTATGLNINLPANANQPAEINLNIPLNTNNNQPLNTNAPITTLTTNQLILQIRDFINNTGATPEEFMPSRDQIITLAQTQDVEPALINLTKVPDFKTRFIALKALFILERPKTTKNSLVIDDFKSLLNDNDIQVKILAGEYLVMLGQKEGFPVLIESLKSNDFAFYSDPPTPISAEVYSYLKDMTQKDLGASYDAWLAWWHTNQNTLLWNSQKEYWQ